MPKCVCTDPGFCPNAQRILPVHIWHMCRSNDAFAEKIALIPSVVRDADKIGLGDAIYFILEYLKVHALLRYIGISNCQFCSKRRIYLNKYKIPKWVSKYITMYNIPLPHAEINCGGCGSKSVYQDVIEIRSKPEKKEKAAETIKLKTISFPRKVTGITSDYMIGVTTAPRRVSHLEKTIKSIELAGFESVHVFSEPGVEKLPEVNHWYENESKLEVLHNWCTGLYQLYANNPNADWYVMCQDDIVMCRGVREYLQQLKPPDLECGLVSLYTSNGKNIQGVKLEKEKYLSDVSVGQLVRANKGQSLWGACCYVLTTQAISVIVRHMDLTGHPRRLDYRVPELLWEHGLSVWYHLPSLVQHTQTVPSSVGHGVSGYGMRSDSFIGEDNVCYKM